MSRERGRLGPQDPGSRFCRPGKPTFVGIVTPLRGVRQVNGCLSRAGPRGLQEAASDPMSLRICRLLTLLAVEL